MAEFGIVPANFWNPAESKDFVLVKPNKIKMAKDKVDAFVSSAGKQAQIKGHKLKFKLGRLADRIGEAVKNSKAAETAKNVAAKVMDTKVAKAAVKGASTATGAVVNAAKTAAGFISKNASNIFSSLKSFAQTMSAVTRGVLAGASKGSKIAGAVVAGAGALAGAGVAAKEIYDAKEDKEIK